MLLELEALRYLSPRDTPDACDVRRPAESPDEGCSGWLSSSVARPGLRASRVELKLRDRASARGPKLYCLLLSESQQVGKTSTPV